LQFSVVCRVAESVYALADRSLGQPSDDDHHAGDDSNDSACVV